MMFTRNYLVFLFILVINNSAISKSEHSDSLYFYHSNIALPDSFTPSAGQLSKDGLEYYVPLRKTDTDPFLNMNQLYVLRRESIGDQFNSPELLKGFVNDSLVTFSSPSITEDKNNLIFVSNYDLFIARRQSSDIDFQSIIALKSLNNRNNHSPWISNDGLTIYFLIDKFQNSLSPISKYIYVSKRKSLEESFDKLDSINVGIDSTNSIRSIWLSNNQLVLYYAVSTGYLTPVKLYRSSRNSIENDFLTVEIIDEIPNSLTGL